jgi:hypothetical protein
MKEILNQKLMTMKTTTLFSALILLAGIFTSCTKDDHEVTPSGSVTTVTKSVYEFDKLEVSDAFAVYVTFSGVEAPVMIEANSNLQPYIIVENRGDRLYIGLDDRISINKGNAVLNVYITARNLDAITAGGAVYLELMNPLIADAVDIHLDGASVLRGTLHAGEIDAELHGASVMQVFGTAGDFHIDASGASHMEGFDFVTDDLKAHLDGASNIQLTVEDELKVSASGASSVIYRGNGVVVSQELSGASSIVQVN